MLGASAKPGFVPSFSQGMRARATVCLMIFLLAFPLAAHAVRVYVDSSAEGGSNGLSWQDAFQTIQEGIDAANAFGGGEVWVTDKTYSHLSSDLFSDSFEALNSNSVDILGQEKDTVYSSSKKAHVTVLYLEGSITSEPEEISFGDTTTDHSFAERLLGLVLSNNVLAIANHPSVETLAISEQDLAAAANMNALTGMEISNQTLDVAKWDYVLANLDDQAIGCNKILWAVRSDDAHSVTSVSYQKNGYMAGIIPTFNEDPVYADRRLAFRDMMKRGSTLLLPPDRQCGAPTYDLHEMDGTASRIDVGVTVYSRGLPASWAEIRFYGCDWLTGSTPGTLLHKQVVPLDTPVSVSYNLTQSGSADGVALTDLQKASIKYIRVGIAWSSWSGEALLQPVRITDAGAWWNGPNHSLAGSQASIGASPYPAGGPDAGEIVYFNPHCHTIVSDGNASPSTMRRRYWSDLGGLDPSKPRFAIVTDHNRATTFATPAPSAIVMKEGVSLYGGFSGSETALSQRSGRTTIDVQDSGRCVYMDAAEWGDSSATTIDGFVFTRGNVDGNGGGMYLYSASPTVRNCSFLENQALYGGGMSCALSNPRVINCRFSDSRSNDSSSRGGAMLNDHLSAPYIVDCEFLSNTARKGGAVFNIGASPRIESSSFVGNRTGNSSSWSGHGGAIYNLRSPAQILGCSFTQNESITVYARGGAIYNEGEPSPTIMNCEFRQNTMRWSVTCGGAIYNTTAAVTIVNCLFHENYTPGLGGAIYDESGRPIIISNTLAENSALTGGGIYLIDSKPDIQNNIIASNSSGICADASSVLNLRNNCVYENGYHDYSGVPNPTGSNGNISTDPEFLDPDNGDFRLRRGSPCIDAGNNDAPCLPALDLVGKPRKWYTVTDMGAYEFVYQSVGMVVSAAEGETVFTENTIVSAVFGDFFYIQQEHGTSALMVDMPGHSLKIGDRVRLQGAIYTNDDGERYIWGDEVIRDAENIPVRATGMLVKTLGGGDFAYNPVTGAGQRGVHMGFGLNNIGTLVQILGTVTHADTDHFYVSDKSGIKDPSGHEGVRVNAAGVDIPDVGAYVKVTGISSCFKSGEFLYRLLKSRGEQDIELVIVN